MKKKYISMVLMAALAAGTLSGCGDKSSGTSGDKNSSTQKDSSGSSKGGDNATAEGKVLHRKPVQKIILEMRVQKKAKLLMFIAGMMSL